MEETTDQSGTAALLGHNPFVHRFGRALTWPLRRFFDPRFANLAIVQNATLEQVVDLRRMAETDMDASNEATAVLGAELSQLRGLVEGLSGESEQLNLSRGGEGALDDLDETAAVFLNYAGSHRGFAAQAQLWFNPPVVVSYGPHTVEVARTNERIVEVPYALRALGEVPGGGRVLDIGSAESTIAFSLACLGYEVTAVDPRGYPLEHPRLRVVASGIENLEDEHGFDAVICLSTVEHIGMEGYGQAAAERADIEAMVRIRALTRPGGLLVLTAPFGRAATSATARRYDRKALDELLEGWNVDEVAFARHISPTVWAVEETFGGEQVDSVVLVTARRSK